MPFIVLTLSFWLSVYFTHQPAQKLFVTATGELWLDLCFLTILLQFLPSKVRNVINGIICFLGCSVAFIEAFLCKRFGLLYSPSMLQMVAETNSGETSEFFHAVGESECLMPTLLPFLLLFLLAIAGIYLTRKWNLRGFLSTKIITLIAVTVLLISFGDSWSKDWNTRWNHLQMKESRQVERTNSKCYNRPTLRLLYAEKFWKLTRNEADDFVKNTQKMVENYTAAVTDSCPDIILVIGESYNKNHAQIYGYPRPTTPHMKVLKNLDETAVFCKVHSSWNITSQVFKELFSTHSVDEAGIWADGMLWPALLKKAGYDTAFFTNQYNDTGSRQNKIDFSGSFFLNTPALDTLAFDHRNEKRYQFDGDFIKNELPEMCDKPQFHIIHLVGQHLEAKLRVPDGQKKWTAKDILRDDLNEKQRQTVADYDNATLYNDSVFYQICQHYRGRNAIVIYFSDHGEDVYDHQPLRYGRNHTENPSKETLSAEYDVPMIAWFSPTFKKTNPEVVKAVQDAVNHEFMTDDVCHFVLGLAHLTSAPYDARRDLFNVLYSPRVRYVRGKKWE